MNFPEQLELTKDEKLRQFWRLGYFQGKEWDEIKTFVLGDKVVKDAVEKYRDFHGLPPGDTMDDDLLDDLSKPRCGVPDFVRSEAGMCRWSFPDVTFAHRLESLKPLSSEIERQLCEQALYAWNTVCGIRLSLIDSMNSANIYAQVGSTGSGVLAWSYLPCGTTTKQTRLQQVYNKSTTWNYNLLLNVLIHEIGHALGLDHGPAGSVMQPTASGSVIRPQKWDIDQSVARYGKPQPVPQPPPTPPTPGQPLIIVPNTLIAGRYTLVPVADGGAADPWNMQPL